MIRFFSFKIDSFKAPLWLGNIGIDDIHIYSMDKEILAGNAAHIVGTINLSSGVWNEILVGNKITASVKAQPEDSFALNWQFVSFPGDADIFNGNKLLNLRWVLSSTGKSRKPVSLRLYFSDPDAERLRSRNSCSGCLDTCSAYQFNILQYTGPIRTINSLKQDNAASLYRVFKASEFNLVPYANGYYAELEAVPEGEFYIQMPERFVEPILDFKTVLNGGENVSIDWKVSNQSQIEKYEIEKAIGNTSFEAGDFSSIRTIPTGNSLFYSENDRLVDKNQGAYYRLKIVYKNGYARYSPEQLVKMHGTEATIVYPNPSNGRFNLQIQQTSGDKLILQVSNTKGQILQTKTSIASGNIDIVTLDISKAIYPPGVYLLKIFNGTESKTLKLVKQ